VPNAQTVALDALPQPIRRYLEAHEARDTATEAALFAADATVVDDGSTHVGSHAITAWLTRATSEYRYTTTPLHAERDGADRYTVTQHLEGDFPGGQVDLHFRFTLREGRIARLVIEP
jgi:hypothetical protein